MKKLLYLLALLLLLAACAERTTIQITHPLDGQVDTVQVKSREVVRGD